MILNFMQYTDKITGEPKIRIGYICTEKDSIENGEKFKGYSELSVFLDNNNSWNDLKLDLIGTQAVFEFEKKPSTRNPLKDVTKLKSIKSKNGNISLL